MYGSQALANLTIFRSNLLGNVWQSYNPEAPYAQGAKQFDPFAAIISCPPHRELKQYGSSSFCNLSKLQKPCIIYSIGSAGNKDFEKAALESTQCQVHSVQCGAAADGSPASTERRQKQHTACFGEATASTSSSSSSSTSNATVPLGLFAHKLGHLRGIDVAHVGLQGEQLLQFLSHLKHGAFLPRQLSLTLQLPAENAKAGLRKAPSELALVFQHMAALGYAATSSKVTDAAASSSAAFSFLHVEHNSARAGRASRLSAGSAGDDADSALQPPLRAKRLVVSVSSFPGRVEYINPTIFSIMHGLRKPDALYIWVPLNVSRFKEDDREIQGLKELPDNVKGLAGHFNGVVKVKIPPKDYGPATKLLPTLLEEKDPDTVIITIDDDSMYRPETILHLEQEIMARPDHAIVWSCEITHWDPKKAPPKKGWREWKLNAGVCRGFPTAFASAAYRREFFDDLVFDQARAPEGCLHHDDVWFGVHLWLRNVPIWVIDGFGIESNCDTRKCWPVLYHRPKNRMSISLHPDAGTKADACLDFFKHMDDDELRKKMMADKGLQPFRPFE
uniref:Methyltransferase domain-containing protein n=1 Tax=Tetradesmus obliquus TaxID=3088 RepID=A0A383V8V7_TETOB|eukprot:jgi/Sobl393_1/10626/SZX61024.1